jgi:hypothetical protein
VDQSERQLSKSLYNLECLQTPRWLINLQMPLSLITKILDYDREPPILNQRRSHRINLGAQAALIYPNVARALQHSLRDVMYPPLQITSIEVSPSMLIHLSVAILYFVLVLFPSTANSHLCPTSEMSFQGSKIAASAVTC